MEDKEKHIETIEQYLAGTLSNTENKEFEKLLNEDADLQEFVELESQLIEGIQEVASDELKSQFDYIHTEIEATFSSDPDQNNVQNIVFELESKVGELFSKMQTFKLAINSI